MDGLQHWQVSDVLCVVVPNMFNEGGKWKCPSVTTDCYKEPWKPKLTNCIDEA